MPRPKKQTHVEGGAPRAAKPRKTGGADRPRRSARASRSPKVRAPDGLGESLAPKLEHPNARPSEPEAIAPGSIVEMPPDDAWCDDEEDPEYDPEDDRRTIRRVLHDDGMIVIAQTTSGSYLLRNQGDPWEEYTRLQDLADDLADACADDIESPEAEVLHQMGWLVLAADVSTYEQDVARREANAANAPTKATSGIKKVPG